MYIFLILLKDGHKSEVFNLKDQAINILIKE